MALTDGYQRASQYCAMERSGQNPSWDLWRLPQSLQENSRTEPQLGHNRLRLYSSFTSHPTIRSYVCSLSDWRRPYVIHKKKTYMNKILPISLHVTVWCWPHDVRRTATKVKKSYVRGDANKYWSLLGRQSTLILFSHLLLSFSRGSFQRASPT